MISFSIANHNSSKNAKGFSSVNINFQDIPNIVKSGFAYSSATFKDGHRNNNNWLGNEQILILDIDDNCSVEQAKKIFRKYNFFIVTTRSHQKNKNNLICDRFRVFIELQEPINCRDIRNKFIRQIMNDYDFVDKSCKDLGRYYFSSPLDALVIQNIGKPMKVFYIDFLEDIKLPTVKEKKQIQHLDEVFILDELKGIWINKYGEILENEQKEISDEEYCLKGAKSYLDTNFYKGNRNNAIFSVFSILLQDGLDEQTILDFVIAENDARGKIPFNELMACFKSAKRNL